MKKLTNWFLGLNIYFSLIPFLLLYLTICVVSAPHFYVGDEPRYLSFAHNIVNGFYSPPYPNINIWNGPGYPAFIASFIFLKLPLIALRILNGFLLYFSLIFSYKTLSLYSSKKSSFLFTLLIGLYFPIFVDLPLICTESLAWFLISLVCNLFIKSYIQKNTSWRFIFLTAFSISFLVMTKVIFGYVILVMIFVSVFMFLFPAFRFSAKKSILIFSISFIFCLPWLLYTFSLTNKPLYWTNSGSMSLYTMSTPYENELGDWSNKEELQSNPNHKVFMDSIAKFESLRKDDAFRIAAIKNIKNYPLKYISNWIANIGRLFFSYPYSDTEQRISSYFYIIPNMFYIVILVLIFPVCIKYYKIFPIELILLFIFIMTYLSGSTLISAYPRMFYITMPFWIFFISFVFNNIISIKIKQDIN